MSPKTGRPPAVSDDEILDVFTHASDPVLTTSEVVDELPIEGRGARSRLHTLVEEGRLATKEAGRARVWWVQQDGRIRRDRRDDELPLPVFEMWLAIDALDIPGEDPDVVERRRDAVKAVVAYLRDNGSAPRRELLEEALPENHAGYSSALSLWKNAILPALEALEEDLDELELDGSTGGKGAVWRFVETV